MFKSIIGINVALFGSIYTVTKDAIKLQKYQNRKDSIYYNPTKPSPNVLDFPEGEPEFTTYDFLKKVRNWVEK